MSFLFCLASICILSKCMGALPFETAGPSFIFKATKRMIYIYIKFYKLFVVANEKQIILIAYNSVQVSTPQIKPLKYLINAKKKLQLNYIIHIISRFVTRSSTWAPQPTHIFLACFHGSHTVSCRINMTCPSWTHVVLDSLMLKCLLWCWSKLSTLKWSPVWK